MFFLGSLTAYLCSDHRLGMYLENKHLLATLGWLSIVVAFLTVPALWRYLVDPEATNRNFHKEFLFYGLVWSISILAAMKGSKWFAAAFELKAFRFIGRISFSVYLWHSLIVQLVSRDIQLHATLQFLLALAITIPLSWLSYQIIERPFIAWGHRTTQNWNNSET